MTGILLPQKDFDTEKLKRVEKILFERFDEKDITLFKLDISLTSLDAVELKTKSGKLFFTKEVFLNFIKKYDLDRFVILRNSDETNPPFFWEKIEFPIYRDIYQCRCGLRSVDRSEFYEKGIYFNPNFSGKNEWIQLYPYNYFHSVMDITKIDKYGFRQQSIDPNKKLILLLGGSGGFDLCSLNEESFGYKLHRFVEDFGYQVINFSLPGYVLLNQYMLYILYLQRLKPYMVISYDGVNDFLNGLKNDKMLLSYNINYTHYLQNISDKIDKKEVDYQRASLEDIAKAYIYRKKQFQEIVNFDDAYFVSILQPLVYSKKEISLEELSTKDESLTKIYQKIPQGYELLERVDLEYHLNLHQKFSHFGADDTLFYKEIYQLPTINDFISKEIFDFIKELL